MRLTTNISTCLHFHEFFRLRYAEIQSINNIFPQRTQIRSPKTSVFVLSFSDHIDFCSWEGAMAVRIPLPISQKKKGLESNLLLKHEINTLHRLKNVWQNFDDLKVVISMWKTVNAPVEHKNVKFWKMTQCKLKSNQWKHHVNHKKQSETITNNGKYQQNQ